MILESAWHYKCLLRNIVSIPALMLLYLRYLGFISTYPDMWSSPITLQRRPSLSGCLTPRGEPTTCLTFHANKQLRCWKEAFHGSILIKLQQANSVLSPVTKDSATQSYYSLKMTIFKWISSMLPDHVFSDCLEERVWNKPRIVVCVCALDFWFITLAITVQRGCVRLWIHFVPY